MKSIDKGQIPVLILAGGLGTRLAEETTVRPKPLVEIGGRPILWHIMRYYSHYGFKNFVICAGYMSWQIKEFFSKLSWIDHDLDFRFGERGGNGGSVATAIAPHGAYDDWRVRVLDTGIESQTGSRVARALESLGIPDDAQFALTYGDGLSNVNLDDELLFHLENRRIGTVLGVHPIARFGVLDVDPLGHVRTFAEKPQTKTDFINGGFFLFRGAFRHYLSSAANCVLETTPLEGLARDGELMMYKHDGFWHCVDTLRDKYHLQGLWESTQCPWRVWNEL